MPKRRQTYVRKKRTDVILQKRDIAVLEMIHRFDGILSLKQIWDVFWPGKTISAPRNRLRQLCDGGYLTMPANHAELRWVPPNEHVYWLDTEGAKTMAGLRGIDYAEFAWQPKGRFSKIPHDLLVNDFRLLVTTASERAELEIGEWVGEREFEREPDKVTYTTSDGKTSRPREIRPDGWFTMRKPSQRYVGKWTNYAYFLEIDNRTETVSRFAREKVSYGIAYLQSELYHLRFGVQYGRFLVVTGGVERMMNMKRQAERSGGERLFYFSTTEQVTVDSIFAEPIWWLAGENTPSALIPPTD